MGHRDLEDILRDIDLNGDGHVDFEGEQPCVDFALLISNANFTAAYCSMNPFMQPRRK